MWHYNDSSVLVHSGIKGQKWGRRRFQNEDRTWTEAGKKRYGKGGTKKTGFFQRANEKRAAKKAEKEASRRAKLEKQAEAERFKQEKEEAKRAEEERRKNETLEEKKERLLKKNDIREIADNMDLFTTQELNNVYQRMQMERNINSLVPAQKTKGEQYVESMASIAKSMEATSKLISNGTTMYNAVAKIANSVTDSEWPIIGEKQKTAKEKKLSSMKSEIEYMKTEKEYKQLKNEAKKKEWDYNDVMEELAKQNKMGEAVKKYNNYYKDDEIQKTYEQIKKDQKGKGKW